MSKSKVHMPENLKRKCHVVIHSATTAAAAAGAIPIPMSDAVPITAAQIGMIISLGKIFDMTLSQSTAKSIAVSLLTQQAGRALFTNILKAVPGAGTVAGSFIGATTAAAITETAGWLVADDFFRISIGKDPIDIEINIPGLKAPFEDLRFGKNK